MEWTRTENDIFRLAVLSSSSSSTLMCLPNEGVWGKFASFSFVCLCASLAVLWRQVCKYHPNEREVGWACRGTETPLIHSPPPLVFTSSDIDPDSSAHHRHCLTHISPLLSRGHSLQFWVCPGIIFFGKCPAGASADSWTQIHRFADLDYGPVGTQCCHLFAKRAQKWLDNVGWNGPQLKPTNKQKAN